MEGMEHKHRIVVKVGSSTLTHNAGHINIRRMEALVKVLSDMKNAGKQVILVSSGAIAVGVGKLGLRERPQDMPTKQAAAAIGQCELMYIYDKLFSEYNHVVAQVLLTKDALENSHRESHVHNTFERLLEIGAIPIVNENDTVAVEEIEFGDNDTLSAMVACLLDADLLILMSDIDGLYDCDPRESDCARLIEYVDCIDSHIEKMASPSSGAMGTGGMSTKIHAAQMVTAHGIDMIIVNGKNPKVLYNLMDGMKEGTYFKACEKR